MSIMKLDANGFPTQLLGANAPQTITVNGSAGAATASAIITSDIVRVNATVDTFIMFSVPGTAVTASTGHFLKAGVQYDIPLPQGGMKASVLAVGVTAGTMYLSELG